MLQSQPKRKRDIGKQRKCCREPLRNRNREQPNPWSKEEGLHQNYCALIWVVSLLRRATYSSLKIIFQRKLPFVTYFCNILYVNLKKIIFYQRTYIYNSCARENADFRLHHLLPCVAANIMVCTRMLLGIQLYFLITTQQRFAAHRTTSQLL